MNAKVVIIRVMIENLIKLSSLCIGSVDWLPEESAEEFETGCKSFECKSPPMAIFNNEESNLLTSLVFIFVQASFSSDNFFQIN